MNKKISKLSEQLLLLIMVHMSLFIIVRVNLKVHGEYKDLKVVGTKFIISLSYKNGSMLISRPEHGRFKSKAVMTSGWTTPRDPMT